MPKVLLPVSHLKQQSEGDCLAACAAMVLQYVGVGIAYSDLLQLLRIRSFGAPAGNVRLLSALGLEVTYSVSDSHGLRQLLDGGQPVIVFVRTGDLPYWLYSTDHAIVVIGYDSEGRKVFVNDPYADEAGIGVAVGDFELAWSERDYHYAIIRA